MYIDNRALLPFVAPFAFLGLARLIWFFAGAEWSQPQIAAGMSMLCGLMIGGFITGILFAEKVSIGGFRIGAKRRGDK